MEPGRTPRSGTGAEIVANAAAHLGVAALVEDHVLRLRVHRPPVNALTFEDLARMSAILGDASYVTSQVKVVLIEAVGRFFCGGSDISEVGRLESATDPLQQLVDARNVFRVIAECAVPVVVVLHAPAFGTGALLAAAADVVIASTQAAIGLPEVSAGLVGGAALLSRWLPTATVRHLTLTGGRIDATRLDAMGALAALAEPEALGAAVEQTIAALCASSRAALVATKQAARTNERDVDGAYLVENEIATVLLTHPDSIEARRAFLEKRAPRFTC